MQLPRWCLLLYQAHLQHSPKDICVKVFIRVLVSDGICAEWFHPIYAYRSISHQSCLCNHVSVLSF